MPIRATFKLIPPRKKKINYSTKKSSNKEFVTKKLFF